MWRALLAWSCLAGGGWAPAGGERTCLSCECAGKGNGEERDGLQPLWRRLEALALFRPRLPQRRLYAFVSRSPRRAWTPFGPPSNYLLARTHDITFRRAQGKSTLLFIRLIFPASRTSKPHPVLLLLLAPSPPSSPFRPRPLGDNGLHQHRSVVASPPQSLLSLRQEAPQLLSHTHPLLVGPSVLPRPDT